MRAIAGSEKYRAQTIRRATSTKPIDHSRLSFSLIPKLGKPRSAHSFPLGMKALPTNKHRSARAMVIKTPAISGEPLRKRRETTIERQTVTAVRTTERINQSGFGG